MAIIATELIETKRDERGRRITPRAEREAVVRSYEQSGLTQKAFAQRERIIDTQKSGVGVVQPRDANATLSVQEFAQTRLHLFAHCISERTYLVHFVTTPCSHRDR
jgi:hypothetical protein